MSCDCINILKKCSWWICMFWFEILDVVSYFSVWKVLIKRKVPSKQNKQTKNSGISTADISALRHVLTLNVTLLQPSIQASGQPHLSIVFFFFEKKNAFSSPYLLPCCIALLFTCRWIQGKRFDFRESMNFQTLNETWCEYFGHGFIFVIICRCNTNCLDKVSLSKNIMILTCTNCDNAVIRLGVPPNVTNLSQQITFQCQCISMFILFFQFGKSVCLCDSVQHNKSKDMQYFNMASVDISWWDFDKSVI